MKVFKRVIALLLLSVMMLSFAACTDDGDNLKGTGDVVMSLDDLTITESEYKYILAIVKNNVVYQKQYELYQYSGKVFDEADVLKMSISENYTVADYITDYSLEIAQQMLIMEKLCKDAGLEITDQKVLDEINNYISDVEYAFGGSDLFEIELTRLGFSRSGIKRFQEFSARLDLLKEYRYGENGVAQISSESIYEYFTNNYIKYDGALFAYRNLNDSSKQLFEFSDDEIYEYFDTNYVKVRHVLYATKNLSEEKKSEKKTKAEEAYNSIKNGEKTLDDFKSETDDNGYEYTFAKNGEMTEKFETAAFEMSVGEVRLVETEFGYHIVEKMEPTKEDCFGKTSEDGSVKGGVKSAIVSALTKEKVRAEGLDVLSKLQNGEIDTVPEISNDKKYYVPINAQFIDKTDSDNTAFVNLLKEKEIDTYFEYEIKSEGTYIWRNCSFASDELTSELFNTIKEKLSIEAFADYTKTFFDSISINDEVLKRFDVVTIPMLEEEFYTE